MQALLFSVKVHSNARQTLSSVCNDACRFSMVACGWQVTESSTKFYAVWLFFPVLAHWGFVFCKTSCICILKTVFWEK